MSLNDRICKVCGNPKRKLNNGCSNPICNFYELENANDLDQITAIETIKFNQTQYLEKLFSSNKNISTQEEFLALVLTLTIFMNSPHINSESKQIAKSQFTAVGFIYIKLICDKTIDSLNQVIKIDIVQGEFKHEISEATFHDFTNDKEKLNSEIDNLISQIDTVLNELKEMLTNCENSFSIELRIELERKIHFFEKAFISIKELQKMLVFKIIEVGIKAYYLAEKDSKLEIKTKTYKISEQLDKSVKYLKNEKGDDVLFARQEGSDTFNIEFYLVNQLNRKTTLSWRLKNYLKDQKSFQRIGFSIKDEKIYLHHFINSTEHIYSEEVKNLVF